jgi:hypothetical protein
VYFNGGGLRFSIICLSGALAAEGGGDLRIRVDHSDDSTHGVEEKGSSDGEVALL